ncbi:hypothetical protein HK100_008715 [Physocladia obscura]|uniref:Domain of unknown function at the cortex 1 domain-containing protein n=1 Tax=Physocladia obscura TaxID=109957 RepID=A0AAD5XIA5_9FUNG|nr:hypothetical protein HK100_008715 [Physocladia obscura]
MSWLFGGGGGSDKDKESGASTPVIPGTPEVSDESPPGLGAAGRTLRVRIGPSLSTLTTTSINNDAIPHFIDSPFFVGRVAVRVRNFKGRTPGPDEPPRQDSPYFGSRRRLFSIQLQGRFKHSSLKPYGLEHRHVTCAPAPHDRQLTNHTQEYSADDVVFGAEFERKVNPPTGAWLAMKFANMIDPALLADLYSDTPWLYSPALCAMNTAHVIKAPSSALPIPNSASNDKLFKSSSKPLYAATSPSAETSIALSTNPQSLPFDLTPVLGDWVWGGEKELHEHNNLLLPEYLDEPKFPNAAVAERRRFFGSKSHREDAKFLPEYVYNLEVKQTSNERSKEWKKRASEIFAPFIDLNTFDLNLGINVNLVRYLNNQPIRLVCKSLSKNIPFFIVEFDLEKDDATHVGGHSHQSSA